MSGYDEGRITFSEQGLNSEEKHRWEVDFSDFIRKFTEHDGIEFPYRDQLMKNMNMHLYKLEVNLDHLKAYNAELHDKLREEPATLMPLFELAAKQACQFVSWLNIVMKGMRVGDDQDEELPDSQKQLPDVQVILTSSSEPKGMRDLSAKDYSTLTTIQGIVISASKPKIKAKMIRLQCKTCKNTKDVIIKPGLTSAPFPRVCEGAQTDNNTPRCPLDPFIVVAEESRYVDQQILKIQELPEMVPTGEMPRHITMTLDRHLVGTVMPGACISAAGIYTIVNQKPKSSSSSSVRVPYLRVLGLSEVTGVGGRMTDTDFTPEEETQFRKLAEQPDFAEKLRRSMAPSIFGHDTIKKALACLLMGGARKSLPDGARLRGDINVLLLGDPSTAKSQMLKFVEKAAPISVYTSGKGSSAAGLTATVVRDSATNEFFLEGGAMVLADGGVVCIDEFDKMRPEDRVAIHEAMEQQTISIAKAGITTVLNTRTSVLAAANPVFGRYDDMKSAVDNIDFQSTILSRFDLIFIIRDIRDVERDERVARHIMGLHSGGAAPQTVDAEINLETLRRYVCYARHKCHPRLSDAGARRLQDEYIRIRQRYGQDTADGAPAIPITVRQLEAIVRISESLARMTLSQVATEKHVEEAVQLFKEATEDAAAKGLLMEGMGSQEMMDNIIKSERAIKERVSIGMSVPERSLVNELKDKLHLDESAIRKAISVLLQRQELELRSQGKYLCRRR